MSIQRGMLKHVLVYPNFEVLQSPDENMGEPYEPMQKMSIAGCPKSWLQDNRQSTIPFFEK